MNAKSLRRLTALLLTLLFLTGMVFSEGAYPQVRYAKESVKLRQDMNTFSTVLATISTGEAVVVIGVSGDFAALQYNGLSGYAPVAKFSENAPTPAPVYEELKAGDKGDAVKALQTRLTELGFYAKKIDAAFGKATSAALSAFQAKNKLPSTGVADQATQELMFSDKAKNHKGALVKTVVATPAPAKLRNLRSGDSGEDVTALQTKLSELGFFTGTADGRYGKITEDAVRAFQKANQLNVDGRAGVKTQTKLFSGKAIGVKPTQTPKPDSQSLQTTQNPLAKTAAPAEEKAEYPYNTTVSASVNLRRSASLNSMRLVTVPQGATISVLENDGNFQKISYSKFTGYVMSDYVNIPEQYLKGKSLKTDNAARLSYETLAVGSEGTRVRALQQALTELGFYNQTIDGQFGAGTIAALKAFQKQNNLRPTGIALPELQKLMYEGRVRNNRNKVVAIKTLPPIEGYPMNVGDYGDAVYALHETLKTLGFYKGNLGYEYTKDTAKSVSAFQKAHSIKESGKIDNFTYLSIKTLLATPAPNASDATQAPLNADNVIIMRSGTRGQAVSQLQERLVALGYYTIVPDGIYSSKDVAAVREFQRKNNLPVTGVADLNTQLMLNAAGNQSVLTPPVETPSDLTDVALKIGMSGDAVKALQNRLITLKYLSGSADGYYGTQTAAAITAFQKASKLTADGIAGDDTRTALYSANAISAQGLNATTDSNAPLKVGSSGPQVQKLQQTLIALKLLKGSADGIYGPSTFLAVKNYQRNNGLIADGVAGSLTLAKLNASSLLPLSPTKAPSAAATPAAPGAGNSNAFRSPSASEVRYADWYAEIKPRGQTLPSITIYDFISGAHYNVKLFSFGKHADGEPVTKEDTAVMNAALGVNNWTPRPVWVIFSDGRVYIGSTHSHGHQSDTISNNDLVGHICIHFPRDMQDAAATGPYAVSHQNAILAGWDMTKNMIK